MSLVFRGLVDLDLYRTDLPAYEIRQALKHEAPGAWRHRNIERELDRRAREARERGEVRPHLAPRDGTAD